MSFHSFLRLGRAAGIISRRGGLHVLLLGALVALTSGCATQALWERDRFARFREPARPAQLRVFQSRQHDDLLVRYDEVADDDLAGPRRARAYWLAANGEPVKNPHKPQFVAATTADGLAAIPVLDFAATNAPLPAGVVAIASTNGHSFALRSGEEQLGNYALPVYKDASGKAKQVLLTPCTVVADLTIIGGVLFLWYWAGGGLAYLP